MIPRPTGGHPSALATAPDKLTLRDLAGRMALKRGTAGVDSKPQVRPLGGTREHQQSSRPRSPLRCPSQGLF